MKIGIDLGTSYSLVARMHPDGTTTLIPDFRDEERFHTPSVALITGGSAFVGAIAEAMVEDHPQLPIIRYFKRHLGHREPLCFDDRGTPWHAESVAALILDKLRFDAETEIARRVDGAVITVPAHFNDPQRKAVAASATLANLPLLGFIEEPVAAALHYGVSTEAHGKVLLAYDFGGGTFDATALSLDEKGIYVLAKTGLTELGGKEIDEVIGQIVLEQFEHALRGRPELTSRALLELRRAAEALKIELSTPGTERVRRTVILGRDAVQIDIDRRRFEQGITPLIEQTLAVTAQCLKEAGLAKKDVTTVLLVGGSSLVPLVATKIRQVFGDTKPEILYHEPSKAVAYGAAMRAAQMAGEAGAYKLPPELKGVTGYSVGVRTVEPTTGQVTISTLIKKNMPLPTTVKKTYYTTRADQRQIVLDFVQFRESAADAVGLGQLVVGPLQRPRVNYPVTVRVDYREDGTIDVVAMDADSGQELTHSFGGDPTGDIKYLAAQRKALQSILTSRP